VTKLPKEVKSPIFSIKTPGFKIEKSFFSKAEFPFFKGISI
jgi:hypothetical protein